LPYLCTVKTKEPMIWIIITAVLVLAAIICLTYFLSLSVVSVCIMVVAVAITAGVVWFMVTLIKRNKHNNKN